MCSYHVGEQTREVGGSYRHRGACDEAELSLGEAPSGLASWSPPDSLGPWLPSLPRAGSPVGEADLEDVFSIWAPRIHVIHEYVGRG